MIALFLVHLYRALEREVVGLRSAAGEHQFLGIAMNQLRNLLAGILHSLFGFPSELMVAAGGVPEFLDKIG